MAGLGPITTSLALPEECTADLSSVYKYYWGQDGWYWLQHGPQQTTCFPSGYSALATQYFSPAGCPYGYTPACSTTYAIGTVATETIQTCCPTEYDYQCQTEVSYPWQSTLGCTNRVSNSDSTTWTFVDVGQDSSVFTTSAGLQGGLNAFSIQVRFQSGDFVTTTSSTNPPTSISSSSIKETASTSSEDNVNDAGQGSSSLGTGAIVGIVVGVLAAVGLTAALIVLFARRQRQKRNAQAVNTSVQEVDGVGGGVWYSPAVVSKYQQPPPPAELHSDSPLAELDAGTRR